MKKKKLYNIAIVGATGLVGQNFIKVLEEHNYPIGDILMLASCRSTGKIIPFLGCDCVVEELTKNSFKDIDIALFSAGGLVSKEFAPYAVNSGAVVIDNSSQWRMDKDIPLVVPEVNPEDITLEGIIANPNCSTIQSVIPLKALDLAFGVKSVLYSTYQAVSGSGQKGIDDLERTLAKEKNTFYPYDISETCIPEIDVFLENGYTKEEMKMVNETRKILHRPDLPISATCIRVPVQVGHGVVIQAELEKAFTVEQIKKTLSAFPGIMLRDDPRNHIYPTSTEAKGTDFVYVGRIRKDLRNQNSVILYCVADNVRKGAASNAVQIMDIILKRGSELHD
ncbi:MAG: aspartate-semialdehyde dehydrogenase [Candidatus Izemoplasmatales bacterium]|jgi:aspartate-semialdehyde dehydrogenase|nr:aspartate-semialdehyde dehydrogenase [Candidatus Izemoplasmatales bacterium]